MALAARIGKAVYDTLSDVLKHEYKADGDNFVLDVTSGDGWELANTVNLKSALSKERTDREKFEKELQKWKDIDPEAAREALKKVKEFGDLDPEKKLAEAKKIFEQQLEDKYANLQKQLDAKHKSEIDGATKKIGSLNTKLQKTMIHEAALRAISDEKGVAELLLPVVTSRARVKEIDNEDYIVEILDDRGNPRISPSSGSTAPMTLGELVKELKSNEKFGRAFDGTGQTGTGAQPGTTRNASGGHTISAADAKDTGKYRAAKEAATKAGQPLTIQEG